jgi:hypothetical protein
MIKMTTTQVASRLIELCKEGKFLQAQEELYDDHILSIDPDASRTLGKENMHLKEQRFLDSLEKIHRTDYSEVQFAGNYFSVVLSMEIEFKKYGIRSFDEICIYQVEKGKIIFEQFFREL